MKNPGITFTPGPTPNTVRTTDGTVLTAPEDWVLLPPGDAALTRRVKEAGDLSVADSDRAIFAGWSRPRRARLITGWPGPSARVRRAADRGVARATRAADRVVAAGRRCGRWMHVVM